MIGLIIAVSSILILIDALDKKIGKHPGGGFLNLSAFGWAFSALMLPIIAIPAYLIRRGTLIDEARKCPAVNAFVFPKVAVIVMVASLFAAVSFPETQEIILQVLNRASGAGGSVSRRVASQADYGNANAAIMDGAKSIGKSVHLQGLFMGLQNINGVPVVMVTDQGSSIWWVAFGEEFKAQISSFSAGQEIQMYCKINTIQLGSNVCTLI